MVICPDCGKEVPKAKFCKNCGAYILNVEEIPVVEDYPVETHSEEVVYDAPVVEDGPIEVQGVEVVGDSLEVQSEDSIGVNSAQVIPQSNNKIRFCYNCGYELTGDFRFCPNCGQDLSGNAVASKSPQPVSKKKNTLLAIILSVLLPGLGQIYLGLDRKGSLFLIGYVISAILILLIIGFILVGILWIWALVDTIISVNAINRGEEVEDKLL